MQKTLLSGLIGVSLLATFLGTARAEQLPVLRVPASEDFQVTGTAAQRLGNRRRGHN